MDWPDNWYKHSNRPIPIICTYFHYIRTSMMGECPKCMHIECAIISKHISNFSELKSQYVEQHSAVTNISELPHLVQAILNIKPTVFKTGGPQYQQQRQRKPIHTDTQSHHYCHSLLLFLCSFVYVIPPESTTINPHACLHSNTCLPI